MKHEERGYDPQARLEKSIFQERKIKMIVVATPFKDHTPIVYKNVNHVENSEIDINGIIKPVIKIHMDDLRVVNIPLRMYLVTITA